MTNVDAASIARAVGGALLIAIGAALIVTLLTLTFFLRTPTYEPSARVVVDLQSNLPAPGEGLQTITQAMIHTTESPLVAEETIGRLGLEMSPDELLDNLTIERVQRVESKKFIVLTYQGTNRVKTVQIVNTLAKVASEHISEAGVASVGAGNVTASAYEEARVPKPPPDPKPLRNGLLTLVIVWALSAGLTLAMLAVLRR